MTRQGKRDASAGAATLHLVLVALLAASACRSAQPDVTPAADACAGGGTALTRTSQAAALAGSYHLRVAATSGARAGAAVEGTLSLQPVDDSAATPVLVLGLPDSTVRHRLTGALALDPAAIGAAPTGDLASTDPAAPGVLVIERRPREPAAPVEMTLRLGADANRKNSVRFDGGYFALTVRGSGPEGFAGSWTSGGAGVADVAGGSFCARRTAP